jgi:hypothetical protein
MQESLVKHIKVFDTTLRDGEQGIGCCMSLAQKERIIIALDQLKTGLDVIEQLSLNCSATLVTSRYDDLVVRRRSARLGIKILPKNYAAYVPISVIKGCISRK